MLIALAVWGLIMAIAVAICAEQHGKNPFLWLGLSLLVSPVVALLLLVMSTKPDQRERTEAAEEIEEAAPQPHKQPAGPKRAPSHFGTLS